VVVYCLFQAQFEFESFKMISWSAFPILVLLFGVSTAPAAASNTRKEYSNQETDALLKFRPLVADVLYRDYMGENNYLITWLIASELDVVKANQKLRKAHQWRKEHKIDTILEEDYSKLEKQFPYTVKGHDLEGRPLVFLHFGSWNLRKAMLAGQKQAYNYYLDRMMENMTINARQVVNEAGSGDIADWIIISDFSGYTLKQQGCLTCIPAIITFVTDYDNYFPNSAKTIYGINVPRIFESVLQLIRSLVSPRTKESFQVHGVNANEWMPALQKAIHPSQLELAFGENKIRKN
jgi:hypothetical protein